MALADENVLTLTAIPQLAKILEASLLVAGKPLSLNQLENLFNHETVKPGRDQIREALALLSESCEDRGIELVEVASGFRLQARQEFAPWVANLFQEKAPRYSRALLETLVLIAYRQPITRGEIEDVRGVAVSSNIIRTLLEREWIRVLGHKDVPGKPALYGTTRQFLDYFNLKRIDDLPTLSEIKDLDQIDPELAREVAMLESSDDEQATEAEIAVDVSEDDTETTADTATVTADADMQPGDTPPADVHALETQTLDTDCQTDAAAANDADVDADLAADVDIDNVEVLAEEALDNDDLQDDELDSTFARLAMNLTAEFEALANQDLPSIDDVDTTLNAEAQSGSQSDTPVDTQPNKSNDVELMVDLGDDDVAQHDADTIH